LGGEKKRKRERVSLSLLFKLKISGANLLAWGKKRITWRAFGEKGKEGRWRDYLLLRSLIHSDRQGRKKKKRRKNVVDVLKKEKGGDILTKRVPLNLVSRLLVSGGGGKERKAGDRKERERKKKDKREACAITSV